MAQQKKGTAAAKKRQVKPAAESVRDKAKKQASKAPAKQRRIKRVAVSAAKPASAVARAIKAVMRPFRFILAPFKTRPARAIGRFLASVLLLRYFRDSWKELRMVKWPNARETAKLTLAVFIFAIFFSLIISVVDFGLDKLFQKLIIK